MMAENETDLIKIRKILEIMKDNDLVEIEIKHGDEKIFLKRSQPQQPGVVVPVHGPVAAGADVGVGANNVPLPVKENSVAQQEEGLTEIKSAIVGTFYERPSPDSEPYVEVGSHIEPQTVVCIIEAMKVMNEIKAEISGAIVEILVTNGQAVEYGQVLFKARPD
jgi:acetyl-CoA carboxylase biotin carboxyl carrier protein